MRRLLNALLGLIPTGYDAYMNTRARFFAITGVLFLLVIFQWMMNYWGFQIINVLIFFALFGTTCFLWTHPAVIAALEALEALRKDEPRKLPPLDANYYRLYLAYVLLWLSIVSMFVTTLPFGWYLSFEEAFGLTLVGLAFLSVIAWIAFFKWTKITIYKKVIKNYAYIGFLVCVWILIPASIKYWATGIDFYGAAGTSETAKEFSKSSRKVAKTEDEKRAEKIKKIGDKLTKGIKFSELSKEEQDFWLNTKKELEGKSLPEKISKINIPLPSFSKKSEEPAATLAVYTKSAAATTPPPAAVPRWEIVTKQRVTYNQWDEENLGYITIAENLPSGRYRIEVCPDNFEQYFVKSGRDTWRPIPPEGLVGEYVTYAHNLPLRGTSHNYVGARIMKINNSEPEYVGRRKEFVVDLPEPFSVKVSENMLQDCTGGNYPVQNNFVKNRGGEWIVLKKLVTT